MKDIQFNHDAESGIESFGLDQVAFNKKLGVIITLFFATLEENDRRHSRLGEFLAQRLTDTEILFLATCQTVDILRGFDSFTQQQINNN